MIRVIIPSHLKTLARVQTEIELDVKEKPTLTTLLDALELQYPMLKGTIRDHETKKRRPFLRFYACEEDLSMEPPDMPLPEKVISGKEPFLIVGSVAGG